MITPYGMPDDLVRGRDVRDGPVDEAARSGPGRWTDPRPPCVALWLGAALVAGSGCNRTPPPEPSRTARGEVAGVPYLERMTGGAPPEARVPMIVALHPMGGDPADLLEMLQRYRRPARLILPYGHPRGGRYLWYDSVREDVAAPVVKLEADRLAAALEALVAARPTVGKPLVTGFSQGGIMAFALVVLHPDELAAAFPISGMLLPSLYPSAAVTSRPQPATLPSVVAFHGADDLAVPTRGARASIAELQHAGYSAELREYAGVGHDTSEEEVGEVLDRLGRTADSLVAEEPAPRR